MTFTVSFAYITVYGIFSYTPYKGFIDYLVNTVAQKTVHMFGHFALNALFHTNP